MPNTTFNYDGDPVTLVANTPLPDSEQSLDIPMFEGFDLETAVKHFKFKFHATQAVAEALYHFKVQFFNSEMEASGDWDPFTIQEGWIGEAGESWGSGPEPENRSTFVSQHEPWGTTEGDFTPPYYPGVYEAQDGGSSWGSLVADAVARKAHLPAGGDWFLRITLDADSPGDVTLHDFSFELAYQEWRPRNFIGPIPLTEGWVCSNTFPAPTELWLILHRGRAYMYGEMLDWLNFNEEEDADWFTEFYDDATTKLVDTGGVPEEARPASNMRVPIRFYDFDRESTVLGEYWELSINTNGSITFVERSGQKPDKLRLGGGDYSFAPMQVNWPIADQTHGPDIEVGSGVTWEVHSEFINNNEADSEIWESVSPLEFTKHGGIAHFRGGASHEAEEVIRATPYRQSGGITTFDDSTFHGAKIHNEETVPGPGQDFGFIQQFSPGGSSYVPPGAHVQFDASPSRGKEPLTYEWDFGDGDTGTGITPAHTYEEAGTYSVTLTVTDEENKTDDVTKDVVIGSGDISSGSTPSSWAMNINDNEGIINSTGERVIFRSGDFASQVFKGSIISGSIPNAPGTHHISEQTIDYVFARDKSLIGSGIRSVIIEFLSDQMPHVTELSEVGRKYGTAICIQEDGSHYRHEVECTVVGSGEHPNTYTHKLYKCLISADEQIGATITNNNPTCGISAQISFSDVESITWFVGSGGTTVIPSGTPVPHSGKCGFFATSGIVPSLAQTVEGSFPDYPAEGVEVRVDAWWPVEYEFDEFSS